MHGVRQQEVSCLVEETLSLPLAASKLVVAGVKNILVKLQFWRMTSLAGERPPPSPGRWSLGTMGEKEACWYGSAGQKSEKLWTLFSPNNLWLFYVSQNVGVGEGVELCFGETEALKRKGYLNTKGRVWEEIDAGQ